MAEWLVEHGIGESRAVLVADDAIVEARVRRAGGGPVLGAVIAATIVSRAPNGRVMAEAAGRRDRIMIANVPSGLSPGSAIRVEIVREAIPERGRRRPAHGRLATPDTPEQAAPALEATLADHPVRLMRSHEPDAIEAAGWSALVDEARTGEIGFPGGRLLVYPTPAMTLIDVDGTLPAAALAQAGADAAGRAIRRLGIAGSIGIDLPTLAGRAERQAAAAALDAALPPPFERTAVNGFGFLQIVRRRERASLPELFAGDPARSAAIDLLRRATRTPGAGARALVCGAPVAACLDDAALAALERATGRPHIVRVDPLAPWNGHVEVEYP